MKREVARDLTYKIIFQKPFHDDFNERYEELMEQNSLRGVQGEYARKTIQGILDNEEEIENIIETNLRGWQYNRLSNQVIAVLKLGIFEIKYNEDIPEKVGLNEAVGLAHKYCDEKEASFVNGLLNTVYKAEKSE